MIVVSFSNAYHRLFDDNFLLHFLHVKLFRCDMYTSYLWSY